MNINVKKLTCELNAEIVKEDKMKKSEMKIVSGVFSKKCAL